MTIKEQVLIEGRGDTRHLQQSFTKLQKTVEGFGGKVTQAFFKFNQAIQAAETAMRGLQAAMDAGKFAADVKRIEAIVGEGLGKRLQDSIGGTISQMDAMRLAAKAMTGQFRFTEQGMRTVLQAADELAHRGFGETQQIAERLFEAIRKGETEELRKFGLRIDQNKDKLVTSENIFKSLQATIADPQGTNTAADNFDRMQARIQDAFDDLRKMIGEVVLFIMERMDALIEAARHTINLIPGVEIASGDNRVNLEEEMERLRRRRSMAQQAASGASVNREQQFRRFFSAADESRLRDLELGLGFRRGSVEDVNAAAARLGIADIDLNKTTVVSTPSANFISTDASFFDESAQRALTAEWLSKAKGKGGGKRTTIVTDSEILVFAPEGGGLGGIEDLRSGLGGLGGLPGGAVGDPTGSGFSDFLAKFDEAANAAKQTQNLAMQADIARESFLTFGNAAFDAFTLAAEGTISFGDAVKMSIGDTMKALGKQAIGKALFYTAEGIAALFTNPPAASAFFSAAAAMGVAGAFLTGTGSAISSGGGGGGGGRPSTPAGGGFATGGSGGGSGVVNNINISISGAIGGQKEVAQWVTDALDSAERSGRLIKGTNTVTFR